MSAVDPQLNTLGMTKGVEVLKVRTPNDGFIRKENEAFSSASPDPARPQHLLGRTCRGAVDLDNARDGCAEARLVSACKIQSAS